jgi:uncharacterized membrane protein YsdA (DUF1294 family)
LLNVWPEEVQKPRSFTVLKNPVRRFALVTVGLTILLAALVWRYGPSLAAPHLWLIAISVVTFLTFGYDKAIAGSTQTRVPETVLLLLALVGGTPGALLGMWLFRHKTAKQSFRTRLWLVIAAQIALITAYYGWLRP